MAVSGYNTVTTFFDESGKFKDHKVIAFGGVAAYNEYFVPFADEWARLLRKNGLKILHAKNAFNARRKLSVKNDRVGFERRIEDLLPFIFCIRKHLQVVTSVTIDVDAFKKLPSHFFQSYGNDPTFVSFARAILKVLDFTPDENNKVGFTCDDDEGTAVHLFKLYRKVKKIFPGARSKMVAITFADDSVLFGLQAADFVAGLMRLEAGKRMLGIEYDYGELFKALAKNPERHENLWDVSTCFGDKEALVNLSTSLAVKRKEMMENAHEE
jgi:hypothetical protein